MQNRRDLRGLEAGFFSSKLTLRTNQCRAQNVIFYRPRLAHHLEWHRSSNRSSRSTASLTLMAKELIVQLFYRFAPLKAVRDH